MTLPGYEKNPFAWLEAIVPPIIVLATACAIKEQILESIEVRHTNEQSFQIAMADWRSVTAAPEDHSPWMQFYANAQRKEALSEVTTDDWRWVVQREMRTDRWYVEPDPDDRPESVDTEVDDLLIARHNGTVPKALAAASRAV